MTPLQIFAAYIIGFFICLYILVFMKSRQSVKYGFEPDGIGPAEFFPALVWPGLLVGYSIIAPFRLVEWLTRWHTKSLYSTDDKPTKHGDRLDYPDEPIQ